MQIRTIKKNSISDQVLQQMQEMIERKEWQEGSRIPSEAQLTEMFGVSRISVRDAIKQLVGLGMLESKQGSGTYVRSSDSNLPLSIRNLTVQKKQDLLELLEFRKAIEVESAGLAAVRATSEQIDAMQEILNKLSAEGLSHEENTKLDFMFHKSVMEASNNKYIKQMIDLITEPLQAYYDTAVIYRFAECNGGQRHQQILNAIRNHNTAEARMVMQFHFDDTMATIFKEEKEDNL